MPVFEDIIVFCNIFVSLRYFQNACYLRKELVCVKMGEKTFLFVKLLFSMWNVANGFNCNLKAMLLLQIQKDFEDCYIQSFFIPFEIEGSESNCHPKEIDVLLLCSGANLK